MPLKDRIYYAIKRGMAGQSLVEFALIIPVLLGVFFAIIDGAFLVQGYLAVNHAAREAARFAVSYQPNQGECYDYNGDGNPNNDGWPWCTTDTGESETVYHARRVEMIKQVAADAAAGLRVDDLHVELSDQCDTENPGESLWNFTEPGMLGVCVWGFPDFESEEEENHPGLQGLPVQVAVIHNVPLVVFAPLTSNASVRVSGVTEMVNEGIQVGYGNKPPPAFSPPGGSGDPGDPGDPEDPDPEDVEPHTLLLEPDTVTNELPDNPTATFVATVLNEEGDPLRGVRVAFTTNGGSFSSEETVQALHMHTTSSGQAVIKIHATVPTEAVIDAWADGNGDMVMDDNEPRDQSTIEWIGGTYEIAISFEQAYNDLPDEREHGFHAHVTSDGSNVAGAQVTFRAIPESGESYAGGFDYSGSGTENEMTAVRTNDVGNAVTSIYANRPVTATIQAWLDYNNNGLWDGDDEPADTATKIWESTGPYLTISNHRPFPEEVIALGVRDHYTATETTSILFCSNDGIDSSFVMTDALEIPNDTGDVDMDLQVPLTAIGEYQVESHVGAVDETACGDQTTRIAYSASIVIADVPPDLIITEVITPALDAIRPGVPITLAIVVSNTVPVPVTTGPFGVDIYVDPGGTPAPGRIGQTKQWITTLGPMESTVITDFITLYDAENHELWFQVDTMNYIDEGQTGGEDNNVFGPVVIVPLLECIPLPGLSDDFDGGLGSQWSEKNFDGEGDDPDGSYTVNGDGELEITAAGSNLWGGPNSYYYLYQNYEGDYDARLQIIDEPTEHNWSKIGLHIAESVDDSRTRFVMNMATHNSSPAAEQAAYRSSWDGEPSRTSNSDDHKIDLPSWVRIVRAGDTYDFYRTDVADPMYADDWIHQGSHTAPVALNYLGIASASYRDGDAGTGVVDDFEVCELIGDAVSPAELVHIPGSVQCEELLYVPGFEGNPETVFQYWNTGRGGTYDRGSEAFYRGSFSMRQHASLGVAPCSDANSYLDPYLYQTVSIPTEVYSISTLAVTGHYLVEGSDLPCSFPNSPDPDDKLLFNFKELDGTTVYTDTVLTGGTISHTWHTEVVSPSDAVDLSTYKEGDVILQWRGIHDGDFDGTFFYLDELSAQLCTAWPIPEHISGMATIGGRATTRSLSGKTVAVVGADIWAYQRGGTQSYHTRTLQDGSFSFYNVAPGEYVIYAEGLWGGEGIRYATVSLQVAADEVRDDLTLFLE
jgi:hypothetical protein